MVPSVTSSWWLPDDERFGVLRAIEDVGREKAAEEHDLGDEKDPHAERCRLALLLVAIEVMGEARMMLAGVAVRSGTATRSDGSGLCLR